MPINILVNTEVVENIHIGASCSSDEIRTYMNLFKKFRDVFSWSYKEIPGIDPKIVSHEIKTYPEAKPIWKKLHPIHPQKSTVIKAQVEKILKESFIYLVPLTDWVSNIVPVTKKQGMIHVCIDYRDINRACPKDNYPTPFITR
jgi:hypothetical protein